MCGNCAPSAPKRPSWGGRCMRGPSTCGRRCMLAKRIIPCLDVRAGRVVKGVHFEGLRDAGDPVALAAAYEAQGADEVVFLDITASVEQRDTLVELVARTSASV